MPTDVSKNHSKKVFALKFGYVMVGFATITSLARPLFLSHVSPHQAFGMEAPQVDPHELDHLLEPIFIETKEETISQQPVETLEIADEDQIQRLLFHYCEIYNVNYEFAYQIMKERTDDFTSNEFLEHHNIKGTQNGNKERSYPSQELGILSYVRALSQKPELLFGVTKEQVFEQHYYDDSAILPEDLYLELCTLFPHVEPEFALAVAYQEGGFKSNNFTQKNNPAGYKPKDTYATFSNRTQGIIEVLCNYEFCYFIDRNIDPNDPNFITTIGLRHTPLNDENDTKGDNKNWIPGVTKIYQELKTNGIYSYRDRNDLTQMEQVGFKK